MRVAVDAPGQNVLPLCINDLLGAAEVQGEGSTLDPLPQRQQVGRQQDPAFTMYGPGGIKYVWQIQYGVKVNVDDLARTAAETSDSIRTGRFSPR